MFMKVAEITNVIHVGNHLLIQDPGGGISKVFMISHLIINVILVTYHFLNMKTLYLITKKYMTSNVNLVV